MVSILSQTDFGHIPNAGQRFTDDLENPLNQRFVHDDAF